MSDFLPYQESLILHEELGFNEPCYAVYSQHDQTRVYDNDSIREGKIIPAILYQQALRFFRDKYGLYDTISKNGYMIEGETNSGFLRITRLTLNSHEEAELACLDKLIEIVEQKEK